MGELWGEERFRREKTTNGKDLQNQQWRKKEWVSKIGSKTKPEWEEVIAISSEIINDIFKEANQLKALLDKEAMEALDAGNKQIIRFITNRIRRIRRCVDSATLEKVIQGDSMAKEKALRALLLCPWEEPIIKFLDDKEQETVERNESLFNKFIIENKDWVDPNTQVMVVEGDSDGINAAANQIHYKSLRNLKATKEYHDFGAKSYIEAVLGNTNTHLRQGNGNGTE